MITFTARNSDGQTFESVSLAEAGAFCGTGESLDLSEVGLFGFNPAAPCCEGPCTHEVNRARQAGDLRA